MNNRLQVGGLALIIGSETGVDDNMGMVVTLTEYIGEYDHPLARNYGLFLPNNCKDFSEGR